MRKRGNSARRYTTARDSKSPLRDIPVALRGSGTTIESALSPGENGARPVAAAWRRPRWRVSFAVSFLAGRVYDTGALSARRVNRAADGAPHHPHERRTGPHVTRILWISFATLIYTNQRLLAIYVTN